MRCEKGRKEGGGGRGGGGEGKGEGKGGPHSPAGTTVLSL